jgi:hypothetical protein
LVITVLKFLLGALIIVLAAFDVSAQPFMVITGLVLMGVLTAEQLYAWLGGRPPSKPDP